MLALWLLAAVVAASVLAAWPSWRSWSPERRRWHAAGAVVMLLPLLMLSSLLLETLVDGASAPILPEGMMAILAVLGAVVVGLSWLASRFPWSGHRPWILLAPPLLVWLLDVSQGPGSYGGDDGRLVVQALLLLAAASALPWAVAGAVTHRDPAWKAQAGVLGAVGLLLVAGGVVGLPGLLIYATDTAKDTLTFTVEPEGDGAYEVWVAPPWDAGGPWHSGLLDGDLSRFVTVEGDGALDDARGGGLVVAGRGPVTVTLSVTFYGPIGMQESQMYGNLSAEADAPVHLRVEHQNRAPYCNFHALWEGDLPADTETELEAQDAYGECS